MSQERTVLKLENLTQEKEELTTEETEGAQGGKAGSDPNPYYMVKMEDVLISSFQSSKTES